MERPIEQSGKAIMARYESVVIRDTGHPWPIRWITMEEMMKVYPPKPDDMLNNKAQD